MADYKKKWDGETLGSLDIVFDKPILLYIKTRILVHGRIEKTGFPIEPCWCCGSKEATIIREIPDIELLIDRVTGERRLKHEVKDKETFDRLAKVAQFVDVPLRCHEYQLPLLLDCEHKILGALGGNRSGKTTVAVYWFVRQILLKGGRGSTFWWVSPSRNQTMIAVEKIVTGEVSDRRQPPALPLDPETEQPLLCVKWPDSARSPYQQIVMVDGTVIALQHASKPTGDNLKGRSVRGVVLDEACSVSNRANWGVLLSRLADSAGQLFFATTPKGGHWLKDEVVDQQKTNPEIKLESLSMRDNPWVSLIEIDRLISVCRDENHVRREIDGQWVSEQGNLWIHFNAQKHTVDDPSFNMVRDRQDITAQACREHWKGINPYSKGIRTTNPQFILGQDFNISPMSTVVAKIFGDPQRPETWGIYCVDEVQKWNADTWLHGNHLLSDRVRSGRVSYANQPMACDATACNYDPTQVKGSVHGSSAAKTLAGLGFDARPCGYSSKGYPQNPRIMDSISLMHKMMREDRLIIHGTRCPQLLRALTEQQVTANGMPEKVSHAASDRLSGPIDALRYLAWAVFSNQFFDRKKDVISFV